jgi:hypothetical protein
MSVLMWLPFIAGALALVVLASMLDRSIVHVVRMRWPAFNYDGSTLLVWGVMTLGALTMLGLFLLTFLQL